MQFGFAQNTGISEHLHRFGREVTVNHQRHRGLAIQSAFGGLFLPFLAVAVAVKADGFACYDIFLDDIEEDAFFGFSFLNTAVHLVLEKHQLFGNRGIESEHGSTTVGTRAHRAELETVTGKGKGRGTVAVGIVQQYLRDIRHAEFHLFLGIDDDCFFRPRVLQSVQHR